MVCVQWGCIILRFALIDGFCKKNTILMSNQDEMIEIEKFFLDGYDKHADEIFRHIAFRIFDRDRAKDILQDTFSRTWEYLVKGRKIDNPRAFLYKVANNLIIDEVKKRTHLSLDGLAEAGVQIEDPTRFENKLSISFDYKESVSLLEQLEEDYKRVMIMRYIEELSVKEIARVLGVSENLVSVRLNRALTKLRNLI